MAACYAVENSLGYQCDPTPDARALRNLTLGVEFIMSHLAHFYALAALDYVQGPGNPFGGGVGAPAQSGPWTPDFNGSYYFNDGGALSTAGLIPFPPGTICSLDRGDQTGLWWEVIQDYTIALQLARMAGDLMGILGGRWPMYSNLVCGGVTHPNLTSGDLAAIKNLAEDYLYRGSATASPGTPWAGPEGNVTAPGTLVTPAQGTILHFIQEHYIPTVQIVATVYSNYDNGANLGLQNPMGGWLPLGPSPAMGYGAGTGNFLSWGAFHTADVGWGGDKTTHSPHILKTGVWLGGPLGALEPGSELVSGKAEPIDIAQACVKEFIDSSKYDDSTGTYAGGLGPDQGYTKPDKSKVGAYSWVKSPRIVSDGPTGYVTTPGTHVCEVGPLARMINSGLYNINPAGFQAFLPPDPVNRPIMNAVYGVITGPLALPGQTLGISAMDRHRARALEALTIANQVPALLGGLSGGPTIDPTWIPPQSGSASGWGTNEAPRGALLHYNEYSQNRITKYQCIVPTTWNASPRDAASQPGPIEEAIMTPAMAHSGLSSAGPSGPQYVPVEALRVVHSFDPCIACAVHKVDGKKAKATKLNTKKEVRRR